MSIIPCSSSLAVDIKATTKSFEKEITTSKTSLEELMSIPNAESEAFNQAVKDEGHLRLLH